jgi:hypothetical protein
MIRLTIRLTIRLMIRLMIRSIGPTVLSPGWIPGA